MRYKYDLENLDLEDCNKLVVLPLNADSIPAVMGTLEGLAWRARHVSKASWEKGKALYLEIQEIFEVNECLTDLLTEIRDKLDALQCICDLVPVLGDVVDELGEPSQTAQEAEIRTALTGNPDVDFTDPVVVDYDQGETPSTYDGDRCQRAQAIFFNISDVMRQIATVNLGGGVLALGGFVSMLAAFSIISLPISIIVGVMLGITALVLEAGVSADLDTWDAQAQDAVCALYNAQTMSTGRAALLGISESVLSTVYVKSLVKALFSTSAMGHFHQNSNNLASFDPDYCQVCHPLPAGCLPVEACDVNDWELGTVVCVGGRAQIRGGICVYIKESMTAPLSPSWLKVTWIPRADSGSVAECSIGVRQVSNGQVWNLLTTGLQTIDVEREDTVALPSALLGQEVELMVKQEGWYAEPVYWCLTDVAP